MRLMRPWLLGNLCRIFKTFVILPGNVRDVKCVLLELSKIKAIGGSSVLVRFHWPLFLVHVFQGTWQASRWRGERKWFGGPGPVKISSDSFCSCASPVNDFACQVIDVSSLKVMRVLLELSKGQILSIDTWLVVRPKREKNEPSCRIFVHIFFGSRQRRAWSGAPRWSVGPNPVEISPDTFPSSAALDVVVVDFAEFVDWPCRAAFRRLCRQSWQSVQVPRRLRCHQKSREFFFLRWKPDASFLSFLFNSWRWKHIIPLWFFSVADWQYFECWRI